MGRAMDVYKAYFDLAWSNPPSSLTEAQEKYFSDDFVSLDKDGNVQLSKEAYTAMGLLLASAFTDFTYVTGSMREEGEYVYFTGHFEGTHTGDLDLSAMGLGVVPASGKHIVWPDSTNRVRIVGGKFMSIQEVGEGGGVGAFFAALGVEAPAM